MKETSMQKRWVKVAVAAAALLIVVFGLVPLFINADTFRPKVESELSSSLGRKVTLGHLSFSLITGSLVADDISVADDRAFASAPFLEARKLHIGIKLGQFFFHHKIQITSFTVDSPSIHLIHSQNGTWNFSSLGRGAAAKPSTKQESIVPALSIGEIRIKNGSATLSSLPASGKPFTCTDIDLSVQQFSFMKPFPFKLSLKMPGDGALQLDGAAGPVSQKDAAGTPFNAKLQLKHFDPVATGAVAEGQGISMVADFNAQLVSNGTTLTSTGKLEASRMQLARNGSPAPQPVKIDYTVSDNMAARTGQVSDIAIHAGSVEAHVNGSYRSSGEAVALDLRLSAPNLAIDQLEELLPAFGVNLPTGSKLHGGTLTANLAITGTVSATTIAGPLEIDNTQLAGFDLGSKIQGINPLGGTKDGTGIEKLSMDVNASPQSTQLSNIYASVPQIGTATGSGSVSPAGALDFNLVAKFNSSSAVGTIANGGLNAIGGMLGNRSNSAASNGIPLTITGTTSNPSIRADVKSMVKQQAGGLLGNSNGQQKTNPAAALKKLFGK
jgi:AsmA protein